MTIGDKKYDYTQNLVKNNGVKTYGIILNGQNYSIHFPSPENNSRVVVLNEDDMVIYVIGREDYITENELYKLD